MEGSATVAYARKIRSNRRVAFPMRYHRELPTADQGKPRAGYSILGVERLSRSRIIINYGMSADAIGVQYFRRVATTPFVKRNLNPVTFIRFLWCGPFDNLLDKARVFFS